MRRHIGQSRGAQRIEKTARHFFRRTGIRHRNSHVAGRGGPSGELQRYTIDGDRFAVGNELSRHRSHRVAQVEFKHLIVDREQVAVAEPSAFDGQQLRSTRGPLVSQIEGGGGAEIEAESQITAARIGAKIDLDLSPGRRRFVQRGIVRWPTRLARVKRPLGSSSG